VIVLAFDTETTGLVEGRLSRIRFQPHVIQFACRLVDLDSGEVLDRRDQLVKPPMPLPEKIVKITGLTDAALSTAPPFSTVGPEIISLIERAPAVAAHNFTFDRDVLNFEADRMGRRIAWPRSYCSVEQTVHVFGYNADLTKLHEHLLGVRFEGSHTAGGDVDALVACLREMRRRDML
jgi:DNA polymerase III epsilon subunit-like protein